MAVAPNSGKAVCPITSLAASRGSFPTCMRTRIPSVTTIALSTSMPRAMIRPPKEIRSRMIPFIPMMMKDPMIVVTSTPPMISPLRRPMKMRRTTITMATASIRLRIKPLIEATTACDWSEMTPNWTPSGISGNSSCIRLSSPCPILTTFPPSTVETPMQTAGRASYRMMFFGGSWYPRTILATSPR